jgi:hypothetical protein
VAHAVLNPTMQFSLWHNGHRLAGGVEMIDRLPTAWVAHGDEMRPAIPRILSGSIKVIEPPFPNKGDLVWINGGFKHQRCGFYNCGLVETEIVTSNYENDFPYSGLMIDFRSVRFGVFPSLRCPITELIQWLQTDPFPFDIFGDWCADHEWWDGVQQVKDSLAWEMRIEADAFDVEDSRGNVSTTPGLASGFLYRSGVYGVVGQELTGLDAVDENGVRYNIPKARCVYVGNGETRARTDGPFSVVE